MVREICKNKAFLKNKTEIAVQDDLEITQDLLDTLTAYKDKISGSWFHRQELI